MSTRMTAMEIEKQSFRRVLRGFDPEEVELYLRSVAEEVERLNLENSEVHDELAKMRGDLEQYRSREQTLQQTLVTAQQLTEEFKERSRGEADALIRAARVKAERLTQDAQDRMELIEEDIRRCKLERELLVKRLRSTIEEHLTLLDPRVDLTDVQSSQSEATLEAAPTTVVELPLEPSAGEDDTEVSEGIEAAPFESNGDLNVAPGGEADPR